VQIFPSIEKKIMFGRSLVALAVAVLISLVKAQDDSHAWHLDVQSWNGNDDQSMHMIVINAGEKMDGVVRPLNASDSVMVMVNQDVDIRVPVSEGDENITLRRQEPVEFNLNDAGRFSFVIILEGEKNLDLPEFLVRSEYMAENEWYFCKVYEIG
jgi:hypothetical protein